MHVATLTSPLWLQVVGSAVADDEPLMSAGLDSLGSVEFANVLGQKLGLQASCLLQLHRVEMRGNAQLQLTESPLLLLLPPDAKHPGI